MTCCHFFCSAVFSMPVCRKPIVGEAERIVSPSSSSTSRSTPWVLGCCGPMLTVIVSVRSSGIALKKGLRAKGSRLRVDGKLAFDLVAHRVNERAVHFLNARGEGVRHIHVHVR